MKHESNIVFGWTHFPLNHGAEGRMNPPQTHLFDFCGLNMFEQLSPFEHCMQAIYMDTTAEKSFISRMLKLQILVGIWTHRWNICAIHLKCTKSYSFFFSPTGQVYQLLGRISATLHIILSLKTENERAKPYESTFSVSEHFVFLPASPIAPLDAWKAQQGRAVCRLRVTGR